MIKVFMISYVRFDLGKNIYIYIYIYILHFYSLESENSNLNLDFIIKQLEPKYNVFVTN